MIAHLLATVWEQVSSGVVGAGVLLASLGSIYQWGLKPLRRVVRQTVDIHGVLLGDGDKRPSLIERLERGDRRFQRLEGDLKDVKGGLQEVNRKMGKMEGTIDVLGAEERQEIKTIIAVAMEREKQRPKDQPERRKRGGL